MLFHGADGSHQRQRHSPGGGNISNKTGCERHGRWIYCYDARATAFWIEKNPKKQGGKNNGN
jgi:hypothetical protein